MSVRCVMAALDESMRAPGVFAAAVEIADRFDARLLVYRGLYVPPEFPPAAHVSGGDPLVPNLIKRAVEELTHLTHGTRAEPPIVEVGQGWRTVVDAATRFDVDLLVVGSHGYHGLDHVFRTNAAQFADRAAMNVLVVHEHP